MAKKRRRRSSRKSESNGAKIENRERRNGVAKISKHRRNNESQRNGGINEMA
jgi:hypothetical protein